MSALAKPFQWFYHEFGIVSIHTTGINAYLIILARTVRMFAYGTNALILAIFFSSLHYSDHQIGIFMTLTLLGDVLLGTYLTLIADRVGRRKVLLAGSFLMVLSGVVFAVCEEFWILLLAAIFGVISVTGGDFGPFRSIEESVLSQLTTPTTRADVLAWYVTMSTLGSSIGSEASGRIISLLKARQDWSDVDVYHALFWVYAIMGLVNAGLVLPLSDTCELDPSDSDTHDRGREGARSREAYEQVAQQDDDDDVGKKSVQEHHVSLSPTTATTAAASSSPSRTPAVIHDTLPSPTTSSSSLTPLPSPQRSWPFKARTWFTSRLTQISRPTRHIMYRLWFLLAIDSLADGMVPYSLTNYFIDLKFQPSKSTLGDITSVAYFLGAIGAVFAGPLTRKIGFINTMVFTHVPSSAAVLFFAAPPVLWLTAALLMVRAGLNNMDQAPRSALIAAVVRPDERTAVMGITSMVRTLAAMAGPMVTGALAAEKRFWIAFVAAGVCRLVYDFGLYALFVNMHVEGDRGRVAVGDVEGEAEAEEGMEREKGNRRKRRRLKGDRARAGDVEDGAVELESLVGSEHEDSNDDNDDDWERTRGKGDGHGNVRAETSRANGGGDGYVKGKGNEVSVENESVLHGLSHKTLSIPDEHQRVRSRSPHRSTVLD